MFTLADARKLGWTLEADGEEGLAYLGDAEARQAAYGALAEAVADYDEFAGSGDRLNQDGAARLVALAAVLEETQKRVHTLNEIQVTSATPLFSLLLNIAEQVGAGFLVGYGGDVEITADVVKACSGETLAAPAPPTAEQVANAQADIDRKTLIAKLAAGTASTGEVQRTLARLLGGH